MGRMADSWVFNWDKLCVKVLSGILQEGPQLLLTKVKDANGQDWWI